MGSALKHPLARGALNFAWHRVTRAAGTRANPMPPPPAGDTCVHCAWHADPEGTPIEKRSIGRMSPSTRSMSLRERKDTDGPSLSGRQHVYCGRATSDRSLFICGPSGSASQAQ